MRGTCMQGQVVLSLNLNLHCYWNKCNGLLQHIFCQSISVPELMFSHIAPDILGWQNIEMLVTATVTLPPASWRNSCQATAARKENWSGFLSLAGNPAYSRHHTPVPECSSPARADFPSPAVFWHSPGPRAAEQVWVTGALQTSAPAGPQTALGKMVKRR